MQGSAPGVALFVTLFSAASGATSAGTATGPSAMEALTAGAGTAFAVGAAISAVGIVLAVLLGPKGGRRRVTA